MGNSIKKKEKKYQDFYQKLRQKIGKWAKEDKLNKKTGKWTDKFVQYLLILPDIVHLMIKLLVDKEVSPLIKSYILMAFVYLISPIDIIPDFIPVAGFVDDLLVSIIILNKIINTVDTQILYKIKTYWAGEDDIFVKVKEITSLINDLSSQIPKSILNFMRKKKS
jgi:uncharacterized membrane protein YkvA (DUF1232 family)